jgi:hypothetical protein
MRVPAVAPLDRDGNEPAAIDIGEGSMAGPAVTNVFYWLNTGMYLCASRGVGFVCILENHVTHRKSGVQPFWKASAMGFRESEAGFLDRVESSGSFPRASKNAHSLRVIRGMQGIDHSTLGVSLHVPGRLDPILLTREN